VKGYENDAKRCNHCLEEKLHILKADKNTLLNKKNGNIFKMPTSQQIPLFQFKISTNAQKILLNFFSAVED
jgi:hypothetical protein